LRIVFALVPSSESNALLQIRIRKFDTKKNLLRRMKTTKHGCGRKTSKRKAGFGPGILSA